ncbi:SIMPL domain-containing protein [Pseudohalioglobus lutimaris]|uniref:SIMPL domain-containing protein n=1 Tax=Pseudohalioglobus lutimaris TaxID=1737061 RepID=A0A2N5WYF4_9GAMM|nr:SIMPL domain-containing protein [Pseudohalioglobus lutimaris]PLW67273.1 SIMPL domain-containing protein [Pseudohalioglobus lutimaris]
MTTDFTRAYVACLAIALLLLSPLRVSAEEPQPQLRVSGQAERAMAADMAVLQLTVTREAETARAALDANSAAMAEVIKAMGEAGIDQRDLQTANFSIQPRYIYPKPRNEQPPKIVGYTVRNSLTVRVRELARLGSLLDQSVSLGVNEGGSVSFTNDDPSEVLAAARTAAVQDALARAETLARAAGVKLGEILEISEQTQNPQPRPYRAERAMMADAAAGAVPVAAGENSYRVVVHISIAIDQ